jgi:hypothetical protein
VTLICVLCTLAHAQSHDQYATSTHYSGRHSPDHARALAQVDVLRHLVAAYRAPSSSVDLQTKAQRALKSILQKCTHLAALEPLLADCPEQILKYIVHQFAKVLPNHPQARKSFVQSRGLQRIQVNTALCVCFVMFCFVLCSNVRAVARLATHPG